MKTDQFDNIIFDLGGVLINLDYGLTTKAFEELGLKEFRNVYSQLAQTSLFDDYETGRISSQRFINELLPHLPAGTTANQVVAAWNAMILDVPARKLELIDQLRGTKRIALLSNTNVLHMQKVRREWGKSTQRPMESFFDEMLLSYEVGLRKPNEEIFSFVCQHMKIAPHRTLFIDDSPQHIEGAEKIGLNTFYLKDPEELYGIFS